MVSYMVRKINEEANHDPPPPTSDEAQVPQASDTEPTIEPMAKASESEHEPPPPESKSEEGEHSSQARRPKNKMLDMPTTPKNLQQLHAKRVEGK